MTDLNADLGNLIGSQCPQCRLALESVDEDLYPSGRFGVCPNQHGWWWDGPSIFSRDDPNRKSHHTGQLVQLSDFVLTCLKHERMDDLRKES